MLWVTRLLQKRATAKMCAVLFFAGLGVVACTAIAWAEGPLPWQIGMQPPATPVKDRLQAFHNELLIIITLITIFVLGLLLYVIVRFHHQRNPVPTRTSHNTIIEMLWTVVPVLILVIIAIPSFKLMYFMDRVPNPDMTIKVTGHQWYWSYEYPDQGGLTFDSNLIPEADLKPGQLRLLDVDNPCACYGHRCDPQLVRSVFRCPRICDRRPAQRIMDEGGAQRRLLRRMQSDLRRQPRLHADQG